MKARTGGGKTPVTTAWLVQKVAEGENWYKLSWKENVKVVLNSRCKNTAVQYPHVFLNTVARTAQAVDTFPRVCVGVLVHKESYPDVLLPTSRRHRGSLVLGGVHNIQLHHYFAQPFTAVFIL